MKSFISVFPVIIIINLTSACITPDICNVIQRDSIYKHTTFNKDFIKDLKSYERLAAFLKTNSDSILAFNPKNPGNCAMFYKDDNGKLTHSTIPPSISDEFEVLYKEFDHIALNYFVVYQDGRISIILNRNESSIDVYHSLRWNQNYSFQEKNDFENPDFPLYKDTMLNENIKYQISIGCHLR
ncbi:hypothetical protein [Pedobacter glucosidilyticus]|uniref:hypothetical protein n=1 Tax=Pedobacter glucosidilyticus TaxID=1122941 RepID=UPI0026ED45F2|nr:hypothetical protein [Pedobacter glucosidilyticus]